LSEGSNSSMPSITASQRMSMPPHVSFNATSHPTLNMMGSYIQPRSSLIAVSESANHNARISQSMIGNGIHRHLNHSNAMSVMMASNGGQTFPAINRNSVHHSYMEANNGLTHSSYYNQHGSNAEKSDAVFNNNHINKISPLQMSILDSEVDKEEFPGGQGNNRSLKMSIIDDDDGQEEFPGASSDQSKMKDDGDGQEEFPGASSNQSEMKMSHDSYDDDDADGDYQEEFPGSSNVRYQSQLSRNDYDDNHVHFAKKSDSFTNSDIPDKFYSLDGGEIKLRHSFVGGNKRVGPTRHSLYHPDIALDRRRSSALFVNKVLEELQKEIDDSDDDDDDDYGTKRKFQDSNEAVSKLKRSLRASLQLDDIFKPETKRADRRRSTRMSLLLRKSLISSWAQMNEFKNSISIPDLFDTKIDRRRSTITESSQDLLKKVFGPQRDSIPPGSEKEILKEILDPLANDTLMTSLLSVAPMDESIGSDLLSNDDREVNRFSLNSAVSDNVVNPQVASGMLNLNMGHA
jgi:hypothetical protein